MFPLENRLEEEAVGKAGLGDRMTLMKGKE